MSFIFGKRKTPAELLRENKRMLDKSIREIDRERQGLQTQEKKLILEIKKNAKQGQMGAVRLMAKDLIRTRHQIDKFYKLKSQLQGVSLRIQTMKSTLAMGEAMKGVTKAMGQMNRQMNLPSLQKIMQEFERQNERMEMTSEVMGDAIDDALEGDEEEEETEELVNQVLDEIGIDVNQELVNAPSTAVAAPAAKAKVAQVETTANEDSGIDSDLQARAARDRRLEKEMEANNGVVVKKGKDEVVVVISGFGGEVEKPSSSLENSQSGLSIDPDPELKDVKNAALKVQVPNLNSSFFGQGSTEPSQIASGEPPMVPTGTLTRRKSSLARSAYSKPKSRFVEQSYPNKAELAEVKSQLKSASSPSGNSPSVASPGAHVGSATSNENVKTAPATPRTPILVLSGRGNDEDDDDEVYKTANLEVQKILVTEWLINIMVFMIERNFLLKKKVLYFVYGLKKSVRVFIWPPFMEMDGNSKSNSQLSFKTSNEGSEQKKEEVIDLEKLHSINQGKVSAWTMKGLIDVISGSGLSMAGLNHGDDDEEGEKQESEISSKWSAKAAAYQIKETYIEEEDLLHFMKRADVDNAFPLFEGATETGKITRSSLKKWLVKIYQECKSLAHSLNDTKTAIEELNRLASGVVLIVIIIVWLLVMGLLTTQVLLFISSQLYLVVFIFGNTAKTVFDAIIFVFVMHPFNVGDCCVIDGVQMVVEEMNILTTVFLRYDNEKIYYPNSVLATKPVSNFYRSPEMSDSVEFTIDFSTSIESIGDMKAKIKEYLESKPQYWRPGHSVLVKEIEDVNKMKMGLYVTRTIYFQRSGDRSSRRCELVLELKKIFEEVVIAYRLLPQEVHLSNVGCSRSDVTYPLYAISHSTGR
ncbi:hypothetical protein NL676_035899 [Syzygium grande]|nr:hypothetical protein NL676_035899 [Syzygium grande]